MRELAVREHRTEGEQEPADRQVRRPFGGDPEERHEQREEQQRAAEVLLADHHDERRRPREQHRAEVLGIRERNRSDASAADGEELALLHEVGREEEGEEDLGELAGLEVDRSDAHPDAGAEVLPADAGHEREQQKGEAEEPDGPAVALEVADPANQHERDDERGDADCHPSRLQLGQVLRLRPGRVEADDEHVAEPVQQPGDRQKRAVGVRREPPDGDVRGELEPQHHGQEGADVGRNGGVLGQGGQDVGADGDERSKDDESELGVAADRPEHQLAWVVVVPEVVEVVEPGRVVVVLGLVTSSRSSMSRSMLAT